MPLRIALYVEITDLIEGFLGHFSGISQPRNFRKCKRPLSYSKKECGSSDISSHFVEFLNVYNSDKSFNATKSSLANEIL